MADFQPSTSKHDGSNVPPQSSTQRNVTPAMFKKRKGTTNKGGEYENLNIANLILNLLKNKNNNSYYISSNDEEYGNFDDVILEDVTLNKIKSLYAIQLKHSNNKITLNKNQLTKSNGDFSIQKYANNFKQIKNHNLSELQVILFTNLNFDISYNKKLTILDDDDNFDIRIKQVEIEQGNLFNTSKNGGRCYKFEIVENEATSRNLKKAEKYRIFFQKFWLYTNQKNADDLKEDIINNFQERFYCEETTATEYLRFVSEWSSLEPEGEKEKLNSKTVKHTIAKLLSFPFVINFFFSGESVSNNTKLLRKAIFKFDVTLLDEENSDKIKYMWQDLGKNLNNDEETTQIVNIYQFFNRDVTKLSAKEKNLLLWLMGKCPIMVPDNAITSKVIELCPWKKFILVGNGDGKNLEDCQVLQNLADLKKKLDEKEYNEILDNFKCSLQGKQEINLREFIDGCDNLLECISVNELVEMLNGLLRFGENKEQLPVPHIERYISKNIINFKGIDDLMNEKGSQNLIIISCFGRLQKYKNNFKNFNIIKIKNYLKNSENKSHNYLMTSSLKKFKENSKKNIYVSQNECSDFEFQQICKKNPNKNCHHLQVTEDEQFQWIESKGDINDLIKYRKHEHFVKESELFNYKNGNTKINIICDDPGMGKSILMKSIKNNYTSTFWVILITATDILTFIKESNEREDFVDYIIDKKYKENANLVRNLNVCERIVFLWDGLDEVCEDDLEVVCSTIEKLNKNGNTQWITSRCHLEFKLEKRFNVFSRRIKQFDDVQQRDYIRKRLKGLECDISEIIQKIEKCLNVAKFNDILGIPLQIFILTELFIQNSDKYQKLLDGIFSLVELYEHFVDEKISIFFKEKLKFSNKNEYLKKMYEKERKNEIKRCQNLALIHVFVPEILNDLGIELNEEDAASSCIEDLVRKVQDGSVQFVHNSYGEYFAALYLFQKYKAMDMKILQKYIFKERFRNVRFIFDLMLAKNHPAHIGVLYKNLDIVKRYLKHPAETDDGERTPFHLACEWGNTYPLLNHEKDGDIFVVEEGEVFFIEEESSDYCSMFKYLTRQNIPDDRDKIFNMRPIDYADRSLCLYPIIKLAERRCIDFTDLENFQDIFRILWYCVKLDYSAVFDVMENIAEIQTETRRLKANLLHMAAEFNSRRFLNAYLKHRKIISNIDDFDALGSTPLVIACMRGHRQVADQLIRYKADVNCVSIKDGFTALHIACTKGHNEIVDLLIRNKADVNAASENGVTPLKVASAKGYLRIADLLIRNNADINRPDNDGFTPLYVACSQGHIEIVRLLIRNYADVNFCIKDCLTSLQVACAKGHRKIVDLLIKNGANVNAASQDELTPLYVACEAGQDEIVKQLILMKADINAASKDGFTPLHVACQEGHCKMVDQLILKRANVNAASKKGFTAMHITCQLGNCKIVDQLIRRKANVNAASKMGLTPLYFACQVGHFEVVNQLILNNADINRADKYGFTPIYIARLWNHPEIFEELHIEANISDKLENSLLHFASLCGDYDMVDHLIKSGSNVNDVDKLGFTPLHIACYYGHGNVIDLLTEAHADVNIADKYGFTPLHDACLNGDLDLVETLIKNSADVNSVDKCGITPFYVACQNGDLSIVQYLISFDADINYPDNREITPIQMAAGRGHLSIVKMLIDLNVNINSIDNDGNTPLHGACSNGYYDIAELLIKSGAHLNTKNNDQLTPLEMAQRQEYSDIVDLFVENNEDNCFCFSDVVVRFIAMSESIIVRLCKACADFDIDYTTVFSDRNQMVLFTSD